MLTLTDDKKELSTSQMFGFLVGAKKISNINHSFLIYKLWSIIMYPVYLTDRLSSPQGAEFNF